MTEIAEVEFVFIRKSITRNTFPSFDEMFGDDE